MFMGKTEVYGMGKKKIKDSALTSEQEFLIETAIEHNWG